MPVTDPVAGSFTGLHVAVFIDGVKDPLVTKGGYTMGQLVDNPHPSGDASPHNIWYGREMKSIYIERQMIGGDLLQKFLTGTPATGSASSLKSNAAVTAGSQIVMATPNTTPASIRVTLNTNPTTVGGYLVFIADDYTTESVPVGSADPAGTTYTTNRAMNCIACLPVGVVTTGTLTFTSLAGATTIGFTDPPAYFAVAMRFTHPVTTKKAWATFSNVFEDEYPAEWDKKTISQRIPLRMVNPNTDAVWVVE
jgi:hypothetical protein